MKYYVGDVARLLGITPSALRFYEEEKIIHTQKTKSGRRYYELGDIARLLSYKKYTAMGISLREVVQQFDEDGDSRHVIGARVASKIPEAREKAKYYRVLADIIESHAQAIEDIETLLGRFTVFLRPKNYMLSDPEDQLISRNPDNLELLRQWVQGMPATRYAFLLPEDAFYRPEETFLGYMVPAIQGEALHMPLSASGVVCIEEGLCVRHIVAMDNSFHRMEEVFSGIRHYMEEKHLKPAGMSIATLIVVESIRNDHYKSYLDVTTPFAL